MEDEEKAVVWKYHVETLMKEKLKKTWRMMLLKDSNGDEYLEDEEKAIA